MTNYLQDLRERRMKHVDAAFQAEVHRVEQELIKKGRCVTPASEIADHFEQEGFMVIRTQHGTVNFIRFPLG